MLPQILKSIGFGQFKSTTINEKSLLLKYELWRGLLCRTHLDNSLSYTELPNIL